MNKQLGAELHERKSLTFKDFFTKQSMFLEKHPNTHDDSSLKLVHFGQNDTPVCLC